MAKIVTFGEIMARMAPAGVLRLQQVLPGQLEVTFAGAEANVAASLAMLGVDVDFVTALPEGPLTDGCLGSLRSWRVGTKHIRIAKHGRFGIYFVEMGANQRPSRVYYDREYSAISQSRPDDFDWNSILDGAEWLHITGITPALSETAAETTFAAVKAAQSLGVSVSCDINFRSKLWRWDSSKTPLELARQVMREIMPHVNLFIGNEDDARLLGISVGDEPDDVIPRGCAEPVSTASRAVAVARAMKKEFPSIRMVASTFREQFSASHNNWSGMLFDFASESLHVAPVRNGVCQPYEMKNIVDRVGSGDAFDAGILFGLTQKDPDLQYTIEFATASSCLAHSIVGDCNFATQAEIEELMGGSGSGRVVR